MLVLTLRVGDKVNIQGVGDLYVIGKNGKSGMILGFGIPEEVEIKHEKKKDRQQKANQQLQGNALHDM